MSVSVSALTKKDLKKFNETTKDWVPTMKYNMNYALFEVGRDSQCLVSNKGEVILKLSKEHRLFFNTAVNDINNLKYCCLWERTDFNLDKAYPIIVCEDYLGDSSSFYVIDHNGKIIAEKGEYEYVCVLVDGYTWVQKNGLWGVVDSTMKIVIPPKYEIPDEIFLNRNIWTYSRNDSRWYMHDGNGEIICSFDSVDYNLEKRMLELDEVNYRRFLKNRSLGITIVSEGGKWGAVDKNGKVVVPLVNDKSGVVYKDSNGLWYYDESIFDQTGECLYKEAYRTEAYAAFDHIITIKDELTGEDVITILDRDSGTPKSFFPIDENRRWHLKDNNEWFLEDINGEYIAGPYWDLWFKLDCPKAWVTWFGADADKYFSVDNADGKAGLIDRNGKIILPMKYSYCTVEHKTLKATILENKIKYAVFYDFKGKEIQPMGLHRRSIYNDFGWHYEGADCTLDAYKRDGKWGLLDMETKKTIVPFCLDDVLAFMNGVGVVKYKGRLYYINEKGEGLPKEAYQQGK